MDVLPYALEANAPDLSPAHKKLNIKARDLFCLARDQLREVRSLVSRECL